MPKVSQKRFCIVTNRHIVDRGWEGTLWAGASVTFGVQLWMSRTDITVFTIAPRRIYYPSDDSIDIGVIPLDLSTIRITSHQNIHVDNVVSLDYLEFSVGQWEHLVPSETVFFPGYPEWYDRNGGRPIMRTGAIVSDPQTDYRRYDGPVTNRQTVTAIARFCLKRSRLTVTLVVRSSSRSEGSRRELGLLTAVCITRVFWSVSMLAIFRHRAMLWRLKTTRLL